VDLSGSALCPVEDSSKNGNESSGAIVSGRTLLHGVSSVCLVSLWCSLCVDYDDELTSVICTAIEINDFLGAGKAFIWLFKTFCYQKIGNNTAINSHLPIIQASAILIHPVKVLKKTHQNKSVIRILSCV
jgi:hypothetical protein